jgi:hypothetical protein
MAIDKKSQHYTSAKNYRDLDGNTRSFDFIDHDVKTKIGTNKPLEPTEKEKLEEDIRKNRENQINKILEIPAAYCADVFQDFTIRGDVTKITWNETMLRDPGMDMIKLMNIYILANNKMNLMNQGLITW